MGLRRDHQRRRSQFTQSQWGQTKLNGRAHMDSGYVRNGHGGPSRDVAKAARMGSKRSPVLHIAEVRSAGYVASGWLLGALVLGAVVAWTRDDDEVIETIATAASFVTVVAAGLAVWLFLRQQADAFQQKVESQNLQLLEPAQLDQEALIGESGRGNRRRAEPDDDSAPAPARPAVVTVPWRGDLLELTPVAEAPVKVFGDLIAHWRATGRTGRSYVGEVEWLARLRKGESRNKPWLVKFSGSEHAWRVAYGGRGVKEIGTVTEHPLPDDFPNDALRKAWR